MSNLLPPIVLTQPISVKQTNAFHQSRLVTPPLDLVPRYQPSTQSGNLNPTPNQIGNAQNSSEIVLPETVNELNPLFPVILEERSIESIGDRDKEIRQNTQNHPSNQPSSLFHLSDKITQGKNKPKISPSSSLLIVQSYQIIPESVIGRRIEDIDGKIKFLSVRRTIVTKTLI